MKKLESLGKKLSKEEQRKVVGGNIPPEGCTQTYIGCNYSNGQLTCDYHIVCDNGYDENWCGLQCKSGDGSGCLP